MTTITTNVDKALLGSSASRLSTPAEGPNNIKVTDESLGDYAAHDEDSSDSEDKGYDSEEDSDESEDEWTKSFTFEYMAEHEPFTALPVNYLRLTNIGVCDMDDGYDLACHLMLNEPDADSCALLRVLIHRLKECTNLNIRATPVWSKEVGYVFYIVTSWDNRFKDVPAQRDTMNAMLREIGWRDEIKWYIMGTWADKWREDYSRPVLDGDA
ncbi:hypothetical protein EDD18DRAFT_1109474 [Armillaria luteobubalina]|uniref:Uncharacterized protein n=1 Tax=Armillaria luteobubalina TaxID=153913 RepID=A0AA39PW84_9AGAR|nr:hypothetical protein EDD18DRAFT_1109474 [Armillaria luteobubalina]